ncbi:iso-1-cytochrome c [Mactra antiquata]
MAGLVGRATRDALLKVPGAVQGQNARMMSSTTARNMKRAAVVGLGGLAVAGTTIYMAGLNESKVYASDMELHPPKYPWPHKQFLKAFDHDSLRRGYEVYKNVCSACHSLQYLHYRDLVGVIFTEDEAKAEAAENMVVDGPNDDGEMYEREGKLTDRLPKPYPNPEAAAAANNGVEPPDLTYIVRGRHGEEDYIFALLTGYKDAPAGVKLGEGVHYNPYYPGGAISMAMALYNEIIEYSDGTPATQSQLAKDVTTFLAWTAAPEHDLRKWMAIKLTLLGTIFLVSSFFFKRHRWAYLKTKQVALKK